MNDTFTHGQPYEKGEQIMIQFYGVGSAFNAELGNNGAFKKSVDGKTLLLIDCGCDAFYRLKTFGVLEGVEEIYVLLTHFHSDHVGSLGNLILYSYWGVQPIMTKKLTVLTPQPKELKELLKLQGVGEETCNVQNLYERVYHHMNMGSLGHFIIQPVQVEHEKSLQCYAYVIEHKGETIYYSGDSKTIHWDILQDLINGKFKWFFQDTSGLDFEGNVHLSLRELSELIPVEHRSKVVCIHIDPAFDNELAEEMGFNVVKTWAKYD